ncbi:MAG: PIN domain-containing protein [Candidatus Adiutrix sp.]|jgi:predicted nucleic acid-binding protein|nr:PIN domain-containing protein [Candidatus Adiutrix sp.]
MILVDTSVLIEFFKGRRNLKTDLFDEVIARDIPFGISAFSYQELLQGARDEREYKRLREYLSTQVIYYPPEGPDIYEKAARLFFDLRRRGVTVRGSIDLLIALTAMENKLILLHNDRDFDAVAAKTPDLKILLALS